MPSRTPPTAGWSSGAEAPRGGSGHLSGSARSRDGLIDTPILAGPNYDDSNGIITVGFGAHSIPLSPTESLLVAGNSSTKTERIVAGVPPG